MEFTHIYEAMLPWAMGINLFFLGCFLFFMWGAWAYVNISNDPDVQHYKQSWHIADMIFMTVMTTMLGLLASIVAAIIWPISMPVELIILVVYGIVFLREFKQKKKEKKQK